MHSVLFLPPQAPSTIGKRKEEGTMLFFNIFPLQSKPGKSGECPLAFGHGARGNRPAPSDESREGMPSVAIRLLRSAIADAEPWRRCRHRIGPRRSCSRLTARAPAQGPRPRRLTTLQARGAALNSWRRRCVVQLWKEPNK
jgi:hypothetical protein